MNSSSMSMAMAALQSETHDARKEPLLPVTITISREAGTNGRAIADAIAARLGWPVYDRELLQRLGADLGVRPERLEPLDERAISWIEELFGSLTANSSVNQIA